MLFQKKYNQRTQYDLLQMSAANKKWPSQKDKKEHMHDFLLPSLLQGGDLMGRPRSTGPPKDSYCIRLEQRTVDRIDMLRKKYVRISAVSGSGRQFSRSMLI